MIAFKAVDTKLVLDFIKHGLKILIGRKAAVGSSIEVAEIYAGNEPLVHPAHEKHLVKIAELIYFSHGFGANVNIRKTVFVESRLSLFESFTGKSRCAFSRKAAEPAGMNHDSVAAHGVYRLGAP